MEKVQLNPHTHLREKKTVFLLKFLISLSYLVGNSCKTPRGYNPRSKLKHATEHQAKLLKILGKISLQYQSAQSCIISIYQTLLEYVGAGKILFIFE